MLWNGVQIVKKVDLEAQRGPSRQNQRRKRNPIDDLRREVSIMRTLRHKNIVSLQVPPPPPHTDASSSRSPLRMLAETPGACVVRMQRTHYLTFTGSAAGPGLDFWSFM